jgi:hypothetical protein
MLAVNSPVTHGLDPRVHLLGKIDCRVRPGNDGGGDEYQRRPRYGLQRL